MILILCEKNLAGKISEHDVNLLFKSGKIKTNLHRSVLPEDELWNSTAQWRSIECNAFLMEAADVM